MAEKPNVVHNVATFFSSCDFCVGSLSVSFGDVKRLAKRLLLLLLLVLVLPSLFELELLLLLADSLDDERRLPTDTDDSVGRAAGATNAVLADELPMLAMESTVVSSIMRDDLDDDE